MPGMNSGLDLGDPAVVAAFKAALVHQGLIALLIFVFVGLSWVSIRAWLTASPAPAGRPSLPPAWTSLAGRAGSLLGPPGRAGGRQLLRIGFGVLWVVDGLLQLQSAMPLGLPASVISPSASSSPAWVEDVVNFGVRIWSDHPVQAAAATVWLQVGIGAMLLLAPRGWWSRLAGLMSVGWGLVVWAFGESFGGIFGQGASWLFGVPGAVLFYGVAGALVALPDRSWSSPRLGRLVVRAMGVFLLGMAVLQAWPGRGFWQGAVRGETSGTLTSMVRQMGQTAQPGFLSSTVRAFGRLDAAHGWAVNLFVVMALAGIGVAFCVGTARVVRPALAVAVVLCVADWVLVQDLGVLGGVGTDPNSMIPLVLLAAASYLALARAPAVAAQPATVPAAADQPATGPATASWRVRLRAATAPRRLATANISSVAAVGAIGVIILGAAPMAAAQASPVADTILAQAIDGASTPLDGPAPAFTLTDQHGRDVSLASLRGKVVLLTFLDPVCTSDCPLEAQEFRQAGQLLGAASRRVELVAIVANPVDYQLGYTQAFDRQERLDGVPNWLFLTGDPAVLAQVWRGYGVTAQIEAAGSMIGHSEYAYVIDSHGRLRQEMNFDPGPGTTATQSSFAAELTDAARQLLSQS